MNMEYEDIRFDLFTSSYCGKKIIQALRKKYGKSLNWHNKFREEQIKGLDLFLERLREAENPNVKPSRPKLLFNFGRHTPKITKIAKLLHLNEEQLRYYILFNIYQFSKVPPEDIIYLATEDSPITNDGYYIQIDSDTNKTNVEEAIREIQKRLTNEQKIHEFMGLPKEKKLIKKQRSQVAPDDNGKIAVYKAIEKEILTVEKDKKKNYVGVNDYERELLRPAIERVVGESLSDEDDAKKEEELNTKYNTWYYEIVKRYQLPTIKKLPTILRLIDK
jgi:hypothetical protein